jgi:hypothetical protein
VRAIALSLSAATVAVIASAWAWGCLPDLVIASASAGPVCGDGVITPFLADGGPGESCDPGPDDSGTAAVFCKACRVACGAGYQPNADPLSGHCYFGAGGSSALDAAASACEGVGAHVVRFVSDAEVGLVANIATESPFWVGLKSEQANQAAWLPDERTNEPGWAPQCPGCFALVEAGATDIPNGGGTDVGLCVIAFSTPSSTTWTQSLCAPVKKDDGGLSRYTMCEREPVGTRTTACAGDACFTVAQTQAAKRYELVGERLGANDAVSRCAALGGALVTFGSAEEREQVGYEVGSESVLDAGSVDFWIGLSSRDGMTWSWDLGDAGLQPPPWGPGWPGVTTPPNRAYVTLQQGTVGSELAQPGSAADASSPETHFPLCELPR